jgi:hypothetical protein
VAKDVRRGIHLVERFDGTHPLLSASVRHCWANHKNVNNSVNNRANAVNMLDTTSSKLKQLTPTKDLQSLDASH